MNFSDLPQILEGFYIEIGSNDFPVNMSMNQLFGFNYPPGTPNNDPIYRYTMNDVENAMTIPRKIMNTTVNLGGKIPVLYLEGSVKKLDGTPNATAQKAIAELNPVDIPTANVFKILNYIFSRMSTVGNNPTKQGFINLGDQELGDNVPGSTTYISSYKLGSLNIVQSSQVGRLSRVTFEAYMGVGNTISRTFIVYFSADSFVERSNAVRWEVYRYVEDGTGFIVDPADLAYYPGDGKITQTEFNQNIISIVFNKLKEGKYKSYKEIKVRRKYYIFQGGVNTGNYEFAFEQFFVFSSKLDISNEEALEQIRLYLIQVVGNMEILRDIYPDLFPTCTIVINPLWDNVVELPGGVDQVVHSLTINNLMLKLQNLGISYNYENMSTRHNIEIFYVECRPDDQYMNPMFIFPLIARDVTNSFNFQGPIAKTYPDYRPYEVETIVTNWQMFRHLLVVCLGILNGNLNTNVVGQYNQYSMDYIPGGTDPDIISLVGNYDAVSFVHLGVKWLVCGK